MSAISATMFAALTRADEVTRTKVVPTTFEDESTPWRNLREELVRIRGYADDWDGTGAAAPNPQLVDNAMLFLDLLKDQQENPPDAVAATPNGGVLFVWDTEGPYTEAQIEEMWSVDWLYESPQGMKQETRQWKRPDPRRTARQGDEWAARRTISAADAELHSVG